MSRKAPSIIDQELSAAITRAVKAAIAAALPQQPQARQQKPQKAAAPPPPAPKAPRSHNAPRGRPPPAAFDFDSLPHGALLTEFETAQVGRWSTNTLAAWRQRPDHPLKRIVVGGRIRYRVGDVRRFIESGYRVPLGRPRKANAMTGAERARLFRLKRKETNAAPAPAQDAAPPPRRARRAKASDGLTSAPESVP